MFISRSTGKLNSKFKREELEGHGKYSERVARGKFKYFMYSHVLELELELNNELEHEPKAVGPGWRRVGLHVNGDRRL